MLLILSNAQYFRRMDTDYINQYVVFSGVRYCLYYAIRDIFEKYILLILSNMHYFWEVNIDYLKQNAVFSGDGYCLY